MHDVCNQIADELGIEYSAVLNKIHSLSEVNPMLSEPETDRQTDSLTDYMTGRLTY